MRRPSRRVAVAATIAFAVAAGAAVALVSDGPRDEATLSPVTEPAEMAPEASPTPSASPTPTPSPSRSATPKPSPTATEEPRTASPTSSAPSYVTNYGPRPPGSVTVPYRSGQTSWDVVSNGIRFRISMTAARAGSPMTWTVRTSASASGCCAVYMLFGDGFGGSDSMPCDSPDPDVSFTHTYNRGGRKEFMVQAGHSRSCGASGDGAVYGTFDVADGPATSQGPSLPVVKFDRSTPVPGHEDDPRYVSLWAEADEADGYLTKLVVNFGDGTTKSFPGDGNPCQRTLDGWPAASKAWLPFDPPPYHRYSGPGTYTLTLTAYSAGCDGKQVQTGKASFTWTVPGSPSPSESTGP